MLWKAIPELTRILALCNACSNNKVCPHDANTLLARLQERARYTSRVQFVLFKALNKSAMEGPSLEWMTLPQVIDLGMPVQQALQDCKVLLHSGH